MVIENILIKSFDDFLKNYNTAENQNIDYLLSSDFAAFLDKKYSLNHLRNEFFYPKSLTLPKGAFIIFFNKKILSKI